MKLSKELAPKLKPWIEKHKPQLVILFGSAVHGMPGPEPDLDLAVFFGHKVDEYLVLTDLNHTLERDDTDIMFLDHAEPIARMSASRGEVIYEDRAGRMERFVSISHREFMDHDKFFKMRRELNQEFLDQRVSK